VLDDPELAARLHARIGVGRFITEDMFNAVARVLMRVGKN
jgi:type III secretory pathway component EscU